jgi:tyrosyl-tRNA synthetase
MSFQYDFEAVKTAILFNTVEVLPTDPAQLDKEIQFLVNKANETGATIRHYIGFEISGQIHIGGGLFQLLKCSQLQKAGIEIVFWMADYHTWLNSKLDGKITTIKKVAREYFAPVLLKTFEIAGGDPSKAVVLYNYDDYRTTKNDNIFWDYEFQCDRELSLNRTLRSLSITGKSAGDDVPYQLTRYPGMQAADVFWLQTHIVQSGLDQRKIYVSARDIAYKIDEEFRLRIGGVGIKPICMFSKLLLGLTPPTTDPETGELEIAKMSKSIPDSCIFGNDSREDIQRKLKKAYCPMVAEGQSLESIESEQALNPILDWCENMIFVAGKTLQVIRPDKFGGNVEYSDFVTLKHDYYTNKLHPMDLKNAVGNCLADWFAPIVELCEGECKEGYELVKSLRK